MIALYDMRTRLTTYDYFTWQVHVKMLGATEIVFRTKEIVSRKWPVQEAIKRYHNYIRPGPAMSGLPSREGTDGDGKIGSHQIPDLIRSMQGLNIELPRMQSVLPPAEAKYTVTLRQTFHNVHKNSDEKVWREFARRIDATVIEDHSVKPIELYDRVALYAGARMNFGVPNGPVAMLYLTPYPFTIMCDPATTAKGYGGHGLKPGQQFPFFLPMQRLVWERASLSNLMREFEALQ